MPILFIGNALNKKPDGSTGWFPRAIIPVASVEKIPTKFQVSNGNWRSDPEINSDPIAANVGTYGTEPPQPDNSPFPTFAWQNIVLTNFQLDLYYMLEDNAAGKPVNLDNMPNYLDVYRDSQWEVKTEGAKEHKKRTNNKRFVADKLYLGGSQEFYQWAKDNNKEINPFDARVADLAYSSSQSKINPYNVWYAVGTFYEPSQASANEPVEDSEAEVVKPIALSAIRDSEDFTKAYVYGEQLMTINEGEYSSGVQLKVKFIFDNGVEKYAEVLEVPSEIAITSSAQAATIEAVSNVPDVARNINPQLDTIADNAPNVDTGAVAKDTLVNSDDIGSNLDVQNLDNALGSSVETNNNAAGLANRALAAGGFRFR